MKKTLDSFIDEVVQNIKDENNVIDLVLQKQKEEAKCNLICRATGVVSGLKVASLIVRKYSSKLKVTIFKEDGSFVNRGDPLCAILGPIDEILKIEKTILSFVRLMSGIASITSKYKQELVGTKSELVYAESYIPSLEDLCIEAFVDGGGSYNDDSTRKFAVLTRNFLSRFESIDKALGSIKETEKGYKTIVEVYNIEEMKAAINSSCTTIRVVSNKESLINECASINHGKNLELMGEIELKYIRSYAKLGYVNIFIPSLTAGSHLLPIDLCFYKRF